MVLDKIGMGMTTAQVKTRGGYRVCFDTLIVYKDANAAAWNAKVPAAELDYILVIF